MSFLLSTAGKDLRRRLRDPLGLVLWLVVPILVGGLLNLAFGGHGGPRLQARVLVVDQDRNFLSRMLLGALGQRQGQSPFAAEEVTLEEGRRRIEAGDGTALLVIPRGFSEAVLREQPCTLTLVTNPAQNILPAITRTSLEILVDATFYAHRIAGEPLRELAGALAEGEHTLPDATIARASVTLNRILRRVAPVLSPPLIDVSIDVRKDQPSRSFGEVFFPSMLFMALFFMAGGLSEDVWREKTQGTLRRALASPHGPATLFAGKLLAAFVLCAAVSGVGLAVGRWGFGLRFAHIALATLWASVSGVLLTALMLFLQLHASNQRTGGLLVSFVTLPLLMVGGSMFPFEAMPEWMARIGRLTPNGWALETLKAIVWGSVDPRALLPGLAGVAVATALLCLLSVRRMAGAFARS